MDTGHLEELARQLCVDSIRASTQAGSGHPTSALSAAHLMAVLFSEHLRYDVDDPKNPANDRIVFSKGHATPLLYSCLKAIGALSDQELLTYRKFGSPLEGHPVPVEGMPWVDVGTGALGQGLPIGLGMALAMRLQELPGRVWVLIGDSEMVEGSVWEALANASHHQVRNLIGILDMNRLGQRGPTMLQWNGDAYAERAQAFGWRAVEVDGHDVEEIDAAYSQAKDGSGPTLIIARTIKGWGVSLVADEEGWHGTALDEEQARTAIEELGGERPVTITPPKPEAAQ
ncbi:MAG: 1-deoxy-D-xylulose-5-phosphate synthase N-terminal domain-containing protein, partial [Acidimicrobiia bacterium]